MNTCLIVIDVQESFRHRPYSTERGIPAYLAAQNALACFDGQEADFLRALADYTVTRAA